MARAILVVDSAVASAATIPAAELLLVAFSALRIIKRSLLSEVSAPAQTRAVASVHQQAVASEEVDHAPREEVRIEPSAAKAGWSDKRDLLRRMVAWKNV